MEKLEEALKPYKGKYVKVKDLDIDTRDVNVALMDNPDMFEETHLHGQRYIKLKVKKRKKKDEE